MITYDFLYCSTTNDLSCLHHKKLKVGICPARVQIFVWIITLEICWCHSRNVIVPLFTIQELMITSSASLKNVIVYYIDIINVVWLKFLHMYFLTRLDVFRCIFPPLFWSSVYSVVTFRFGQLTFPMAVSLSLFGFYVSSFDCWNC